MAEAMQVYLESMLCQSVYLYQGDAAKATQFLSDLENALANDPSLQALRVTLPTDKTEIIEALAAGNCVQAATLLANPNAGKNVGFGEWNQQKNAGHQKILEVIKDETLKRIIVVLLSGADILGANHGISTNIQDELKNDPYLKTQNYITGKFISRYFHTETIETGDPRYPYSTVISGGEKELDSDVSESLQFILSKKQTSKDKIVILGYSWGGVLSMHLARKLKEKGVNIQFLVVIDGANGFWSDQVNRQIPSNVKETYNYFQENPTINLPFLQWSRGYPASGNNVLNLKVNFVDKDNKIPANHTNIDGFVLQSGISQTIISKIR